MSESNLDYDPLQQQIHAALSLMDVTIKNLEALASHVGAARRRQIGDLVRRLHRADILTHHTRDELRTLIEHLEDEITQGERCEIIVDEHYVGQVYTQVVHTAKAQALRDHMPTLRQIHAHLAAINHLQRAETLAFALRAASQR